MGEGGVGGAGGVGVAGDCMVVPGACPRFPWPGLGGLLAHRLWRFRCPPVAEVAGGDADGGVLPAMVCLMPLAWLLNPGEDGPSLPLLFVTPRVLNPWETRQGD